MPNVVNLISTSGSALITEAASLKSTATVADTRTIDFSLSVVSDRRLRLLWQPASILNLLTGPLTPSQQVIAIYLDTLNIAGPDAALEALIDANEAAIRAALIAYTPSTTTLPKSTIGCTDPWVLSAAQRSRSAAI